MKEVLCLSKRLQQLSVRLGWHVHPHDCCGSITKVHPSDCHHESSALLVQIATPVVAIAATDKRDNAALV